MQRPLSETVEMVPGESGQQTLGLGQAQGRRSGLPDKELGLCIASCEVISGKFTLEKLTSVSSL